MGDRLTKPHKPEPEQPDTMRDLASVLARMLKGDGIPHIDHRQWPEVMLDTPEGKALSDVIEAAEAYCEPLPDDDDETIEKQRYENLVRAVYAYRDVTRE